MNVKVYGFLQFKGIERSGIAGMMTVMDLVSFRDLYGYLTAEKAAEIRRLKETMGARELDRDEAEAELFGGGGGALRGRGARRRDRRGLARARGRGGRARAADLAARVYSQEELERGVALNAAHPRAIRASSGAPSATSARRSGRRGSGLKVVDWQQAPGPRRAVRDAAPRRPLHGGRSSSSPSPSSSSTTRW